MIGERLRVETARNGQLAGRLGLPVTDCPFDMQVPVERALAAVWVRAYLAARPPLPTEIDYGEE